jgi:ABC-type amino acid transport substrate-binding protein
MTRRGARGFLYADVLVALLVLATCLPAALSALSSAARAAAAERAAVARRYRVTGLMEQLLATPHAALDTAALATGSATAPTSYSDAVGTPERRLVYIARYDVDNADADGNGLTGGDAGLLWLKVSIEGQPAYAIETLTAQ